LDTLIGLEIAEQYICKSGRVKNIELGKKVKSELYRQGYQEGMVKVTLFNWLN
jgi:hypothetical protein